MFFSECAKFENTVFLTKYKTETIVLKLRAAMSSHYLRWEMLHREMRDKMDICFATGNRWSGPECPLIESAGHGPNWKTTRSFSVGDRSVVRRTATNEKDNAKNRYTIRGGHLRYYSLWNSRSFEKERSQSQHTRVFRDPIAQIRKPHFGEEMTSSTHGLPPIPWLFLVPLKGLAKNLLPPTKRAQSLFLWSIHGKSTEISFPIGHSPSRPFCWSFVRWRARPKMMMRRKSNSSLLARFMHSSPH